MSISSPTASRFTWRYSNADSFSATPGTSVVPGASDAEGAYTQIASSANIANEVWEVVLWISGGNTTAQSKSHLLDLGIDEAGGTSYTAIISNLPCGSSTAAASGGQWFRFPIKIKSGSSVAVRIQGVNATAGTVRVAAYFYGRPSRPELVWRGHVSETIGTVTTSEGVSITPVNGSKSAYVSLGTTTRKLSWWQLGVQCDNGTITQLNYYFDLAYGDGSNKHLIIQDLVVQIQGTAETLAHVGNIAFQAQAYCPVPAGGTIYVRAACTGAPVTGWNVLAIGIG